MNAIAVLEPPALGFPRSGFAGFTPVGPRPPLPREAARYTLADRRRLAVKPGITCLWQIGGRSRLDFPRQVTLDIEYIEDRNFWFDVKILVKTVPAVISGDGAC